MIGSVSPSLGGATLSKTKLAVPTPPGDEEVSAEKVKEAGRKILA